MVSLRAFGPNEAGAPPFKQRRTQSSVAPSVATTGPMIEGPWWTRSSSLN